MMIQKRRGGYFSYSDSEPKLVTELRTELKRFTSLPAGTPMKNEIGAARTDESSV